MQVMRKIFTRVATNLYFDQFSGDIFFSSLVSFSFFDSCFFCLFDYLLPFELKNVYYNTHATMWAGAWWIRLANFRKQDYFFLAWLLKHWLFRWICKTDCKKCCSCKQCFTLWLRITNLVLRIHFIEMTQRSFWKYNASRHRKGVGVVSNAFVNKNTEKTIIMK